MEIAPSFDAAWASFQARDTLRLAGDALDSVWTHGRAKYLTVHVRIEDAAAREHLARVGETLAGIPGVDLLPDWYWHITVKGVGFQVIRRTRGDEVLRQDVARIAGKARAFLSRQGAFDAQLGPVNAFADVVFVEVVDGGRCRRLNAGLLENVPEIPRYLADGDGFLPHVSVARFTSQDGLDAVKATLAELRGEGARSDSGRHAPGPSFPVRRVELVTAWFTEEVPEFDTVATFPLSAGPAPLGGATDRSQG